LVWDDNLASAAQQWADYMASINDMVHSPDSYPPGQGENLFSYFGTNATPNLDSAAQDWCAEIANYSGQPIGQGNFESYGHYTQVKTQFEQFKRSKYTQHPTNASLFIQVV
jgi:hypothetical protein